MTDCLMASGQAGLSPDFEAVFGLLPSPYMIIDRDMTYVAVNDAYCASLERRREDLVGHYLFDVFPPSGEGGRLVVQSFRRVFETGEAHSLAMIPYPIERPPEQGGGLAMRYWSAAHVPLKGPDGQVRWLLQNTVDVTELQQLKTMAYGPNEGDEGPSERQLLQRAREVQAANAALTEETRGLRDLFMQAPGFMAVLAGQELVFSLANQQYQQLIGHRPVIGKRLAEALPEVVGQGFMQLLHDVMRTGEPFIGEAVSVMLQRTPDAPLEERFADFIYQPIKDEDGGAWGVFVQGSDVTDRVLAERRQKLLLDELNHRVKNTLATVQAISAQTLRTTQEPSAFRQAFEARLIALSATHDLLVDRNWRSAGLRDVVLVEFRPYGQDRYRIEGPEVDLTPTEAVALGLLIHELATNAAKYGALLRPEGYVELRWSARPTAEGRRLVLDWREHGGPPVAAPTRRGFGSRLIERSLKGALKGEATLDYAPEGLRCHIELPLSGANA